MYLKKINRKSGYTKSKILAVHLAKSKPSVEALLTDSVVTQKTTILHTPKEMFLTII